MYNIIFDMAYIIIISLSITVIINNIIITKLSLRQIMGLIIISAIPNYLMLMYEYDRFSVPILTIIMIMYLYILFRRMYYSILISIFTQIIFALSDGITGVIFMLVFKFNYSEIINNKNIYFAVAIVIFLFSTIISKLINRFLSKLKYDDYLTVNGKNILILIVCLTIVLISIYACLIMFKYLFQTHNKLIAIMNLFIVLIFFVLLIIISYLSNKNYKHSLEKKYRDEELANINQYTAMIENKSTDLRKFKHDYANIIKVIGYYIDAGDIDKLKAFYKEELVPESEKVTNKDISITKLENIKINPIKVFISSKISIAEKKNIKVHIEVEEDITEISIGIIDLCRIIGILFDNAIEAAELCENKFIELAVIKDDNNIIFIINNSCLESTPPVYKLYKKSFSTKGTNRGIGLKSAMNIINTNYSNISLNISMENCVFKQELIICNFTDD